MEFPEIVLVRQDNDPDLLKNILWTSVDPNQEQFMNSNNKFDVRPPLCLLTSQRKVQVCAFPDRRSVFKLLGSVLKPDAKWSWQCANLQ
jgi:phosphodiesterase/alkaline phosphatase D-like protein